MHIVILAKFALKAHLATTLPELHSSHDLYNQLTLALCKGEIKDDIFFIFLFFSRFFMFSLIFINMQIR